MNFSRFRVTLTCSLLAAAATAYAQTTAPGTPGVPTTQGATPAQTSETAALLPESDDDIPVEVIPRFDNAVSFGLRRIGRGPKVRFGNLGTVVDGLLVSSTGSRYYSNGTITADSQSNAEYYYTDTNDTSTKTLIPTDGTTYTNVNGEKVSIQNGVLTTYSTITDSTDSTGNTTHTILSSKGRTYTEGQTRTWSYTSASQLATRDGASVVGMSVYQAISSGATADAESRQSSGFDLQFERRMGRLGSRFEWGVSGGFGLSDIDAQTSGEVRSRLQTMTDYFQILNLAAGTTPATTQPNSETVTGTYTAYDETTQEYTYTDSSGAPTLGMTQVGDTVYDLNGTAIIRGVWKIKGSYYFARVGPMFRYRLSEKLAIRGSAGFALGWAGTVFTAQEMIINVDTASVLSVTEENETHKFVPGWYGELNAEYWLTERTGFYGGVNYQKMGDYTQRPLSGRTAKVDLGSATGFQFGLITRF